MQKSAWARAFYEQAPFQEQVPPRRRPRLAFKWIRIVFRCWKDHTPYDEALYLKSLAHRASPLEIPLKNTGGLRSVKQLLS